MSTVHFDRQFLLKRPLTTVELQALSAAATPPSAAPTYSATQEPLFDRTPEPEDKDMDLAPERAPLPAATAPETAQRHKGIPSSLVIAVAIITILFVVAAIIIMTQLR
jgi:hypothetical protein